MSSSSRYDVEMWRICFWVIIGILIMCVIWAIRSTCIDIANFQDSNVIILSSNGSNPSKGRTQSKEHKDILPTINRDGNMINDV